MKKYILLCTISIISLQLEAAATGFVRSSTAQARRFIPGLTQQTQRFMATQTPKATCPTGRCAAGFKNMFSGMPRQFSNAWSQYRRPVALGALGLGGAGIAYNAYSLQPGAALAEEERTYPFAFDRKYMTYDNRYDNDKRIEGYWATDADTNQDEYKGKYPFPTAHAQPWPTQDEFLRRLQALTQKAKKLDDLYKDPKTLKGKYYVSRFRGLSLSRFEPDVTVGSREFAYADPNTGKITIWTEAFGPYYVAKFNVKPSQEFYDWVMNNPDGN